MTSADVGDLCCSRPSSPPTALAGVERSTDGGGATRRLRRRRAGVAAGRHRAAQRRRAAARRRPIRGRARGSFSASARTCTRSSSRRCSVADTAPRAAARRLRIAAGLMVFTLLLAAAAARSRASSVDIAIIAYAAVFACAIAYGLMQEPEPGRPEPSAVALYVHSSLL